MGLYEFDVLVLNHELVISIVSDESFGRSAGLKTW